jgi:hypothetical protein
MRFRRRLLPGFLALALAIVSPGGPARPRWVARYCRPFPGVRDGAVVWRPDSVDDLAEMLCDDLSGVVGRHEREVLASLARRAA